jgi:hypothetical protein
MRTTAEMDLANLVIGFGIGSLLLSPYFLYAGLKERRLHRLITDQSTVPVADADPSVDRVELHGTAAPDGAPVTAPVTGEESALAVWSVEEWDDRGEDTTGSWREIARGVESTGLLLTDDTGTARLDVDAANETAGEWWTTADLWDRNGLFMGNALFEFEEYELVAELDRDDEPPAEIRRLHDAVDGLDDAEDSWLALDDWNDDHGDRRYYEQTIPTDGSLHVVGSPTTASGVDVGIEAAGDDPLIVSDMDEATLTGRLAGTTRMHFQLAAGCGVLSVALFGIYAAVWGLPTF